MFYAVETGLCTQEVQLMSNDSHAPKKTAGPAGNSIQIARAFMDSLLIEGRIVGATYPNAETELFGEHFKTPIMPAALGHLHTLHNTEEDALAEIAKGAMLAGAPNSIGMGDNEELGTVLATGAKTIKIIKPYEDQREIMQRIEYCETHGALAVGMDVEHAVGTRDAENDLVMGMPMKQPSLDELRQYIRASSLPFIIKGALSVQDVLRCIDLGCKGVILSHHNGLLKYAVPPVMLLPEIRKAVGNDFILIADGGMESGYDVFKALALGADFVTVGRPLIPVVKNEGAEGVKKKLQEMTDELKCVMIRTGSKNIASIDPSVIRHVDFR